MVKKKKRMRLLLKHWGTNEEFTSGERNFVFLPGNRAYAGMAIIVDRRYRD